MLITIAAARTITRITITIIVMIITIIMKQ